MTDDTVLRLAAVRRVKTKAGALRFNKAIGQIIGQDAARDNSIERRSTLTKLLSIYNRMRAAKLYGQEEEFKRASAEMADAVDNYGKKSPQGAKRIRDVVAKLTFEEEAKKREDAVKRRTGN